MEQTEILIVEQLRQGREAAYKFLYDHHYLVLCHVAEQYVKDSFLSETIVSDVIFHLWEIHETLEIHTSIRSYLVQAVRNRCLNFLNSQVTKREKIYFIKCVHVLQFAHNSTNCQYAIKECHCKESYVRTEKTNRLRLCLRSL